MRAWYMSVTLATSAALFYAGTVQAQTAQPPGGGDAVNSANNPLTPKITLNLQDYFLPALNRLGG